MALFRIPDRDDSQLGDSNNPLEQTFSLLRVLGQLPGLEEGQDVSFSQNLGHGRLKM